jgi:DUF2075 family protein
MCPIRNPARDETKPKERGGHPHYDNVDRQLSKLGSVAVVPYLLNVYRILLTRATQRLYVAFLDDETREYVASLAPRAGHPFHP